jgi:amidase
MPGSCCGIVVKPSRMRAWPRLQLDLGSCCSEFVMSRSVRDSAWLLDEVAGQDVGATIRPATARPSRRCRDHGRCASPGRRAARLGSPPPGLRRGGGHAAKLVEVSAIG